MCIKSKFFRKAKTLLILKMCFVYYYNSYYYYVIVDKITHIGPIFVYANNSLNIIMKRFKDYVLDILHYPYYNLYFV